MLVEFLGNKGRDCRGVEQPVALLLYGVTTTPRASLETLALKRVPSLLEKPLSTQAPSDKVERLRMVLEVHISCGVLEK